MIYTTVQRKLKIEEHESHLQQMLTRLPRKGTVSDHVFVCIRGTVSDHVFVCIRGTVSDHVFVC
jgi:hypothetical protein